MNMPENPLTQARFDHVDDAGRLVFASGDERFFVDVDETLERAILEAKQIREESRSAPSASSSATLPISQIQALIRAGADPARVAERYRLSEALVRRFSSAVEVEKQYAIEQFLTVPAPKESRGRTTADVVERALALSGIGMESVTWKATRRGLEPWKIAATFDAAGRTARAEWSWNMHDNAVACLNSTAKKLLGTATGALLGALFIGILNVCDRKAVGNDAARGAARGFGTLGEDRAHRVGVEHPCPDTACGSPRSADATFGVPVGRAHRACAIRGRPLNRHPAHRRASGEGRRGRARRRRVETAAADTGFGHVRFRGSDGARDRIRIRQDVCRTLRPADAACETPFGSLRRAQLGRDSLRRVGSSGPPTLSSETRQSFFTEKRDRPSR